MNIVHLLLDKGCSINAVNDSGYTALLCAYQGGQEATIQQLLDAGADPSAGKRTVLGMAALGGHIEIVRRLIEQGCSINAVDDYGCTALLHAYHGGQEAIIQQLLDAGADPLTGRRTALGMAAAGGHIEIVRRLIEQGCSVNAVDDYGCTALLRAYGGGQEATTQQLLDAGADPSAGKRTALSMAAIGGHIEIVRRLIEQGHDVNELDANGDPPLTWAYIGGNKEAIDLLLQSGADPGLGRTARLVQTAAAGHTSLAQDLIHQGDDINDTDEYGLLPLAAAVYYGRAETVKLLLEKGADTSLGHLKSGFNPDGLSCVGLAQQRNLPHIVKLLKSHGVTE